MTYNPPIVSGLTAGVLLLLQIVLMFSVIHRRVTTKQSLGEGGDADMLRVVRRHGNFAENAAIFAVCFGLLEILGEARPTMEWLCALFVLGRLLHVLGLSLAKTVNLARLAGTVLCTISGVIAAVRLVSIGVAAL
jgi:uncharacterized protein